MGKKIIGVIAFAAIAAAGWNYQQNKNEVQLSHVQLFNRYRWNYQQNKNEVQLSDLALENVEALAWDENKSNYHLFPCPSSSGNECRFKDSERPECYGPTYCR